MTESLMNVIRHCVKSYLKIFCFTVLLFLGDAELTQVKAQSVGGVDLKSMNVDDLSDERILSLINNARERGLSQTQLETLAREKGVSETEIVKLRRRIESLSGSSGLGSEANIQGGTVGRGTQVVSEYDVFGSLGGERPEKLTDFQEQIFGFGLFTREGLTFAPNLNIPTPIDYQLGPGDELLVDLWGSTQQLLSFTVSPEGTIRPQNLGPIYVNGLTIQAAESRIIDRLSQVYSGLKGDSNSPATIFHQVSLGKIRTINVNVVGEVFRAGNYALPSLATAYTALHAAGGPTENGSFRNVQLVRDNKLISTIDIYDFLMDGIKTGDTRLKNGDVIIVRPVRNRVTVLGPVNRPGKFEIKEGEMLNSLLDYAGGFKPTAFKEMITVERNGPSEREIIDVDFSELESFQPQNGDLFRVSNILNRFSNRVSIKGAVIREGQYELSSGLTLKALIDKAGGLRGDVFLPRATIFRLNDNYSQEVIPVDLESLMNGQIEDITLKREDIVSIESIYSLKEEYYVQVTGEILEGGVYPFFHQMTVQDLIVLAGGLKESASTSLIEISRRNRDTSSGAMAQIISIQIDKNLSLVNEDRNLLLEPFDQVYIRKSPGYIIQKQVSIEGEVVAPGTYSISRKDERVSDLVVRAKGLTEFAYPKGAILIRKTEFASTQSSFDVSQRYLDQLRTKLLSNESELKTEAQADLLARLKRLQERKSADFDVDAMGAQFKKGIIKNIESKDSLLADIQIANQELTILDLEKILNNPGSQYDYILKEGDIISIPSELETVRVAGEVISPLNVRYDDTFDFKDYINDAGGFTYDAKKGRSYVQYPNGRRKQTKRFLFLKFYPKVEPGSTIFVGKKREKQPLRLQEVLGITSSLATIAFLIDRISR